jgi:hypothetical protein
VRCTLYTFDSCLRLLSDFMLNPRGMRDLSVKHGDRGVSFEGASRQYSADEFLVHGA